jgi:hypothetical protein
MADESGPENPPGWWNDPNEAGVTVLAGWNFNPDPNNPGDDPNDPDLDQRPDWCDGPPHVGSWGDMQPMGGGWGISGRGKSGQLYFWIWNQYVQANVKEVWLQYDIYKQQGGATPTIDPAWPVDTEPTSVKRNDRVRDSEDLGNGWTRITRGWFISPQPMWEIITIDAQTSEWVSGQVIIDNVWIGTHCEGNGEKQCHSEGYDYNRPFAPPDQPEPTFYCSSSWYGGTEWAFSGSAPLAWMPELTDHQGVLGIPPGSVGDFALTVTLSDAFDPDESRPIFYQYDRFVAGGEVYSEELLPPGTVIENRIEMVEEREEGWERVMVFLDANPRPDWESIRFTMFADGGGLDAVALDNVILSAGRASLAIRPSQLTPIGPLEPAPLRQRARRWRDNFESYASGSDLHGQGGWKGWGADPTVSASVTDAQAHSVTNSADIREQSDLVREYAGYAAGAWSFTTWQYIPLDGSFLVMLNSYSDSGPWEDSDWSVQLQFDSNDGMLKVFHGNGLDTIDVPYVTDRWVKIEAIIDLESDWTQVYYDDALVTEYTWTGGVLGEGGGVSEIAAVDLYANGSSSVFYDDLKLAPLGD